MHPGGLSGHRAERWRDDEALGPGGRNRCSAAVSSPLFMSLRRGRAWTTTAIAPSSSTPPASAARKSWTMPEIGRATCRERGGQYGSNQVVGGALKRKK